MVHVLVRDVLVKLIQKVHKDINRQIDFLEQIFILKEQEVHANDRCLLLNERKKFLKALQNSERREGNYSKASRNPYE